nr:uncharacterized protein LOC114824189 [Malus domestica]
MNDTESQELIQAVSDGKKKYLRIRNSDGMLMQGNRIYVPNIEELKKDILDEAHVSAYAMHPGSTKMYHTIRPFYYWPGNKRKIAEYVSRYAEALSLRLLYSTAYHPQMDGQSERTIKMLEDMLRSSILQFGDTWHKHLALIEFAYNNSYQSSIDMPPFEALYGVVWFGKKGKLSPWYIGLYLITERVGEVAYRLELPPELLKVHDVFHVSMLRHYVSNPSHMIPPQPLKINPDLAYDEEPVTILDWKDKVLGSKIVRMVKVL